MVTMADVAKKAEVSVSTVSHVLNGTRAVADATRVAVLAAIEATGYTPNTVARSLATAKSNLIGVALSSISNPYFAQLVSEIESQLADQGFAVLLADPREDPNHELSVVRAIHERRVGGLMIAPGPGSRTHALRYLASVGMPTVLVDRLASADFDQVGVENVEPTAHLVQHLAEQGHRSIGFVAGRAGLATTEERIAGYRLGLAHAGLEFEPDLVKSIEPGFDAADAVRSIWARNDHPTGLVVANNQMTIQAMRGLREMSLRVPEDVALVVFDDFEWADLFHPSLTAMAQPVADIAGEGIRLMLSRMHDPFIAPRSVRLSPTFMHRESCGCSVQRPSD